LYGVLPPMTYRRALSGLVFALAAYHLIVVPAVLLLGWGGVIPGSAIVVVAGVELLAASLTGAVLYAGWLLVLNNPIEQTHREIERGQTRGEQR